MHIFCSKNVHYCCICKHWFDPACSAITPVSTANKTWGIVCDMYNDRKICMKNNLPKSACGTCGKFESKV